MSTYKSFRIFLVAAFSLNVGCTKDSDQVVACNQMLTPVYLNFKVVNKVTSQDLFFAGNPLYNIKDLYFFKTKDITQKDTIRPTVENVGAARYFKLTIDNTKLQDTLVMKIANSAVDQLITNLKRTEDVCPILVLDKIQSNGIQLTTEQGVYTIRK